MKYFLAALIITGFLFAGCENDLADVNSILDDSGNRIEKVFDVEMVYTDSARIRVKIIADEMHRITDIREPREHFPNGVYVEFYNEEGQISSWLRSDKADQYQRRKQVVARNNVILYNIEQDTFRSEELIWDADKEKIYTEGHFRFTNPDQDIVGYNFESDPQFTNYKFSSMTGTTRFDMLEKTEKPKK